MDFFMDQSAKPYGLSDVNDLLVRSHAVSHKVNHVNKNKENRLVAVVA